MKTFGKLDKDCKTRYEKKILIPLNNFSNYRKTTFPWDACHQNLLADIQCRWQENLIKINLIKQPLLTNVSILYAIKTPENLWKNMD